MPSIDDAIQFRSLKVVQELLDSDSSLLSERNDLGETPLHVAARSNKAKVVEYLIRLGADVNARDGVERTPLAMAVSRDQQIKIAKLLIEAKADVHARVRGGLPIIWWAAFERNAKVVDLLLKNGVELDLNSAVFLKPVEYFQEQLEKNPNALLEAPCPEAFIGDATKLFYGGGNNPEEILALVELFLKHKADPNARAPIMEQYPLIEATRRAKYGLDLAKLLLQHGADPNVRDTYGWGTRGWSLDKFVDDSKQLSPTEKEQFKSLLREYGAKF